MGKRTWSDEAVDLLRVREGFSLADCDPDSQPGFEGKKKDGEKALETGLEELSDLQEMLYAGSRTDTATEAVLLVLQGMDTAGKGGIVRHVVGAVDPQGVLIAGFGAPTREELAHDFLWRVEKKLPRLGFIGVFDRSHYEDVLIGRVRKLATPDEIERRYRAINHFERRARSNGIRIVKVMLHISRDEQHDRLSDRLENADKHWKYHPGDVDERLLWDDYMEAYQLVLERTSTDEAPWFVVPANEKWYARLAVQEILLSVLEEMDLAWPAADYDVEAEKRRLANSR